MQKMRPSEANPPAQVLVGGGVEPQKGTEPLKGISLLQVSKRNPHKGFRYCKLLQVNASRCVIKRCLLDSSRVLLFLLLSGEEART